MLTLTSSQQTSVKLRTVWNKPGPVRYDENKIVSSLRIDSNFGEKNVRVRAKYTRHARLGRHAESMSFESRATRVCHPPSYFSPKYETTEPLSCISVMDIHRFCYCYFPFNLRKSFEPLQFAKKHGSDAVCNVFYSYQNMEFVIAGNSTNGYFADIIRGQTLVDTTFFSVS